MRKFQLLFGKYLSLKNLALSFFCTLFSLSLTAQTVESVSVDDFCGTWFTWAYDVNIVISGVTSIEDCEDFVGATITWNSIPNPFTIDNVANYNAGTDVCSLTSDNQACSGGDPVAELPATIVLGNAGSLNGTYMFDASGVLPVELTRFSAAARQSVILLSWQTATELNNEGFEVQRSPDAETWSRISFVEGNGTTNEKKSYEFTDRRPLPGHNYYRLKQIDFDGQYEYTDVVSASIKENDKGPRIFPNPATGSTTIVLESDEYRVATITIFDSMGKRIITRMINPEEGFSQTPLDLSDLSSGMYLIQIQAGKKSWQQKLIVK